ncbi:MAG: alpha/beta hydrolase [Polyangiaceae bacterium]|nr:alpha/beta hydrolase [Polyangiaceae bacterium]
MSRLAFRAARMEERTIVIPSGQVHAWVSAARPNDSRPTLLLLHGFGSDGEQQWAPQVYELSQHYRVVVPDFFYFGGSWPFRPSTHLDDQIQMVLELMTYLRIDRTDVLGISYGGFVAFELAARFGRRIGKVVISNSPGPFMAHDDHAAMLRRLGVEDMADLLVPSHPRTIRDLVSIAFHKPPPVPSFAARDAFRSFFRHYAGERRKIMRQLQDRVGEPGLADRKVVHPTLVLWGEHDRVFPVGLARRLASEIGANARLHVIPSTAHAPNQERHREYNRVVLSFLNERRV